MGDIRRKWGDLKSRGHHKYNYSSILSIKALSYADVLETF